MLSAELEFGLVILKKIFKKFVSIFSLFRYYLPLEKNVLLYLNNLKSPLPKDALCHVWLNLTK